VAIVGSGPAGLTAAFDLVRKGYGVTVYDSSPVAGGWLTNGIPDFILPKEVVEGEIQRIRDMGVKIKTGVAIGKDITLDDLKARGYSAILLATGAQRSVGLRIPGADSKRVLSALDVLRSAKLERHEPLRGKVLVIGGGRWQWMRREPRSDWVHRKCMPPVLKAGRKCLLVVGGRGGGERRCESTYVAGASKVHADQRRSQGGR
jgi:NADPH-dependent 2,4-dienoyl-CoA reductase/sulfur reductase-like enzyme